MSDDMNDKRLMQILLEPRVTEKSTLVGDKHKQFVFRVLKDATKPEIRRAVEQMFEVKVRSVQTSIVKGKQKTFKMQRGRRADWKKAYVSLQPGFDIDFIGG